MHKSSKEDSTTVISNFHKILLFIRNLFNEVTSADDFTQTIKYIKNNSKKMNLEEKKILTNILTLNQKTVEDVMIPRSDIAAIKATTTFEDLIDLVKIKIPHTRTLIYNKTLDNIIGFIHIKDLFKALLTKQHFQLKTIIRKHIVAAPSMKLIDLLAKMRRDRTHIAIVIDEYGGTDGMVTIEDIMKAIVGRIDDEHDKKLDSDNIQIIDSNTIISNARVEVEVIEELIGIKLKKEGDEFDTIGGFILSKISHVPVIGTKVNISGQVEIEIIDATPRTLKQIKLIKVPVQENV